MKVWIDTDIGGDIDDALALLLAISTPEIEIIGVSTVFQNTIARAKIAKTLLTMGKRGDVKVYAGIGEPLNTTKVFNDPVVLDEVPKTYIPALFDSAEIEKEHAVEALHSALVKYDDLVVVTLGALTNIASLLTKYPQAAKRIKKLYIMGTAIWLNLNEFNISCDPEAADIVMQSDLPKKVVSLDVTFKCELKKEDIDILEKCQTPLVKTVLAMHQMWGAGMILHDPLTLSEALREQFVTFTPGNLKVELDGEFSRGKCINLCDFNWNRPGRENLLVSSAVNNSEFTKYFVNKIYAFDKTL